MLHRNHFPENPFEFSKITLELPYLKHNSPSSCPVSMSEIMDYLHVETIYCRKLSSADLHFVNGSSFWLWRFYDNAGEDKAFVMVELRRRREWWPPFPRKQTVLGYNSSDVTGYGETDTPTRLIPEQFILAMHYSVF